MNTDAADLDATRAAITEQGLLATASAYITSDVATRLPFESLGPFKNLLKQFFSNMPWTNDDAAVLSDLVIPHLQSGWWEHDLGGGVTLAHGIADGDYRLLVGGGSKPAPSLFDRAFDGPVIPEPTPHPRKVKFTFGGRPSPGNWHRRNDADPPSDERARRLLAEPDVTDVMVAGDFVTVGLAGTSPWEKRLEPMLGLVTELFAGAQDATEEPERTREELLREAAHASTTASHTDLHLLDPNDDLHISRLREALGAPDPKVRRVAVAILAEADDADTRRSAVEAGYRDRSRLVRRTAVDAAADAEDQGLRTFLEQALAAEDSWIRWRAVRGIGTLGVADSRSSVEKMTADREFRVRFEAERVLRDGEGTP